MSLLGTSLFVIGGVQTYTSERNPFRMFSKLHLGIRQARNRMCVMGPVGDIDTRGSRPGRKDGSWVGKTTQQRQKGFYVMCNDGTTDDNDH